MPILPPPRSVTIGAIATLGTTASIDTRENSTLSVSAPTASQEYDPSTGQISICPVNISFDAAWLLTVEQRIKASIAPAGYPEEESGVWLQSKVGSAAVDFFRSTSTALPSEPYIYASKAGDLVAEFATSRGKLTCIVAPQEVYVFAVAGDEIVEKKFVSGDVVELRSHLQHMTNLLRPSRQNGTLDAG